MTFGVLRGCAPYACVSSVVVIGIEMDSIQHGGPRTSQGVFLRMPLRWLFPEPARDFSARPRPVITRPRNGKGDDDGMENSWGFDTHGRHNVARFSILEAVTQATTSPAMAGLQR